MLGAAAGLTTKALAARGLVPAANRILRAAAKRVTPIVSVMDTPPTYSAGTGSAASTINGNSTNLGAGRYNYSSPEVEKLGGSLDGTGFGDTIIGNIGTLARQNSRGVTLRFATDADAFDICLNSFGSAAVMVYVTDPATGLRQRVAASDIVPATGYNYLKWTFATAATRIIEVCTQGVMGHRGINVAAAYSIWKAPAPDEPRVALLWDSYGAGSALGGATNLAKLYTPDFLGETLGVSNVYVSSRGGTGFIAGSVNGSTAGSYRQRLEIGGDMDVSRVGTFDAVFMPASVNDALAGVVGSLPADAAIQAEAQLAYSTLMTKQPNAIIFGCGPQTTTGQTPSQSRFDAVQAGFLAAAGSDPRMIWLDNSPAGEGWLKTANVATYIGADNTHLNNAGVAYLGRRMGNSAIAALKTRYGI